MKIAMILAEGFEEAEAVITADLLRRAGVDLILTGLDGGSVCGSHGITLEADRTLDELPDELDGVVLPGGMPGSAYLGESEELKKLVCQLHNDSSLVAAICAAPAKALAAFGILDGRKFTCYPGLEMEIPSGQFVEEPVVVDGNIITSRGVGTAGLFGLALVEYLVDRATAQKLGKATLLL